MSEMQTSAGLQETRRQQARDLRTLLGNSQFEAATDTSGIEFIRDKRFNGEYGLLAERLFCGLGERATATGNERLVEFAGGLNVLHGCYVMGKILSYGPSAYLKYLADSPETKDPAAIDLGNIMLRSKKILRLFADKTQRDNTTYEINFGLHQYSPVHEKVPFRISPNESGLLVFSESPVTLMHTRLEIARRNLQKGVESEPDGIHCPASGRVLDSIWSAAVEECVKDASLFSKGLSGVN